MPTVLVTGASSGIGLATALHFADQGWNVVATLRHPEAAGELGRRDKVLVTALDVADPASVAQAVQAGLLRFGALDVLVNNAGFSLYGPLEGLNRARIQEIFNVNILGLMDVTRAVLPHMRSRRRGVIVNVGSRAGQVGLPLLSLYSATKFAVEGFSEALSYELEAVGVAVKLVAPAGGAATAFGERLAQERALNSPIPDYDAFSAQVAEAGVRFAVQREGHVTTAGDIARVIFEAATDPSPRLRYSVGHDIPPFIRAKRELPDPAFMDFMRESHAAREGAAGG